MNEFKERDSNGADMDALWALNRSGARFTALFGLLHPRLYRILCSNVRLFWIQHHGQV